MARYIDANKLIDDIEQEMKRADDVLSRNDPEKEHTSYAVWTAISNECWRFIRKLKDAPTEDVAPVVHAKFLGELVKKEDWRGKQQSYFQPNSCSNCHTALYGTEYYCPHCGAKLDER